MEEEVQLFQEEIMQLVEFLEVLGQEVLTLVFEVLEVRGLIVAQLDLQEILDLIVVLFDLQEILDPIIIL